MFEASRVLSGHGFPATAKNPQPYGMRLAKLSSWAARGITGFAGFEMPSIIQRRSSYAMICRAVAEWVTASNVEIPRAVFDESFWVSRAASAPGFLL